MSKQIKHTFPFVIVFYAMMLISFFVGASTVLMPMIITGWDIVSPTTIPYDVIGWFWMAIASVYVGGTAMLNVFTSRNLHDLSSVDMSSENLKKVTIMNYFAVVYCLGIKLLGVDIPLEAIIAAAGTCTIFIVANKKVSQTVIQTEVYHEDEELHHLVKKLSDRILSGEYKDEDGSGKDDIIEEIEAAIEKRKQFIENAKKVSENG